MDDIKSAPEPSRPPRRFSMLREWRTFLNISSLPLSITESFFQDNEGSDSLPIILLPGFASDERYMKPLSAYLKNLGYQSEGWGLGFNLAGANLQHTLEDLSKAWNVEPFAGYSPESYKGEGGVPYLCDLAIERIRLRSEQLSSRVILIGWSLGGYIAREVARDLPSEVAYVITLGSPVIGGPKYTQAAAFFKAKGHDLDWVERESGKRDSNPIQQPITAIYSKSDAVVDWRAAVDKISPNVEHVEVKAAHLGMGFNRQIWQLIRRSLVEFKRRA